MGYLNDTSVLYLTSNTDFTKINNTFLTYLFTTLLPFVCRYYFSLSCGNARLNSTTTYY